MCRLSELNGRKVVCLAVRIYKPLIARGIFYEISVAMLMSTTSDMPDQIVYLRRSFQLSSLLSHRLYAREPNVTVRINANIDSVQNINKKFILVPEACYIFCKEMPSLFSFLIFFLKPQVMLLHSLRNCTIGEH